MPRMNFKMSQAFIALAAIFLFNITTTHAQSTRPDSERQLAHDIYKEFIEIRSGFTTGATTPVAEAAAARLKAAGFPDSDIALGGAIDKKGNLVVRYHGTGKQNLSSFSPTPTSSKPSAKTGRSIPSSSPKKTATSTAAAPATTKPKPPSGSPT
jgi:hypothetical protein